MEPTPIEKGCICLTESSDATKHNSVNTTVLANCSRVIPDGGVERVSNIRNSQDNIKINNINCVEKCLKPKSACQTETVLSNQNSMTPFNVGLSNSLSSATTQTGSRDNNEIKVNQTVTNTSDEKETALEGNNEVTDTHCVTNTNNDTKHITEQIKPPNINKIENVKISEQSIDILPDSIHDACEQEEAIKEEKPNYNDQGASDVMSASQSEDESSTDDDSVFEFMDADSEKDSLEFKPDTKLETICEEDENSYHEETNSLELLNQTDCSDTMYCETSFSKCDADSDLSMWNQRRKHSKARDRKESLEQRLRRRFTIHDEHKQEVAKRIIALVIKYSLFVFNFCSWVIATVAIGLGLWVLTDKGKIVTDSSDFFLDPTIMICIVGGITFVVAFLGCVGALRENLLLLKVFFIVLGIIVVIEVIIAITVFVMYTVPEVKDKFLRSTPENILRSAIIRYMDNSDLKQWMDFIQQEFRCCGIGGVDESDEGFRDWQINNYFNCTPSNKSIYRCAVPTSCCIFEQGDRVNIMCGFEMSDKKLIDVRDYIYTRGCIHGFGEWLSKYDELIVIASLSTLIMQFLAVISAKIMIRRIEKTRRRWSRLLRSSTSS